MKCSILEVSLLLAVLNPGTAEDGDDEDVPEVIFSNGSSPVLLPCSEQSHTQIKEIQWTFEPASGNNRSRICTIDYRNPQCSSPRFPHITLADTDGFRTGNYSLLFTATMKDAGNYICFLYPEHLNKKMEFRLIVIHVSVTPAGPILLGTSINLTCEMSDPSYFNSIDWSIENTQVNVKGNKIQWKLNNTLIHEDKRHTFDFTSLNISNVELHDAGRYTYTIRLKNEKACYYSRLLQISGTAPTSLTTESPRTGRSVRAPTSLITENSWTGTSVRAPTSLITENSWTGTADPHQNSKRNIITGGVLVGVAVVAIAMILIALLIKSKCKSADQNSAPVQNNEDNYATINLDALGKPGKGVTRSEEAIVYAEVKTN